MNRRQVSLGLSAVTLCPGPLAAAQDQGLFAQIVDGPQRTPANRVRDRYRHPIGTLEFWGLRRGMTVVEIDPSGGYWTELLAPFLKSTGGHYIAALPDYGAAFRARFSDRSVWGPMTFSLFNATSGPIVPNGSADMVFTARNVHNWMWVTGMVDKAFSDFAAALRTDGVLGVEEHRADPRPMVPDARDGYVSTAFVRQTARRAGLRFDGASEINANPKDTKDYPFGVWTLPPTNRTHLRGQATPAGFNPAIYEAIGESDRMTLRFRKA